MKFFPALRGRSSPTGAVVPLSTHQAEVKSLMSAYTNAMIAATSSSSLHDRARPWSVERAIDEAYGRVVWAFRCVQVISGSESRLKVRAMDQDDNEDEDDPYVRLLNGQANPIETGAQLRKRLVAQILLSKSGAFIEESRTNGGKPYRLDLLPPGRTRIIPGRGQELISHYEVTDVYGYKRGVDPERVIWFRDPHPLDPYSGVTPLESAGLSLELDHFARLYNATFLRNDGRPGGIVAVKGTGKESGAMTDKEMDRIEDKFGKGPSEAGRLTVLSGEVSYVEPGGRPRDSQYSSLSTATKAEILGAFGVGLSLIGDSSERTYANADKEGDNFWLVEPMPGIIDIVNTGFSSRMPEDLSLQHNTDDIEPVLRAEARKREEAREEVAAGLRSPWSYAELAKIEGVESTPHTRALYVATGRTPIPATEEDAIALGLAQDPNAVPPADPALADAQSGQQDPASVAATAEPAAIEATPGVAGQRTPAQIVAQALEGKILEPRRRPRAVLGVKAVPPALTHQPDHDAREDSADAIGRAVNDAVDRLIVVAIARLRSPKQRRGTRHFEPEFAVDTRVGTKALDTPRAVDADQWSTEIQDAARPYVRAAAQRAADAALTNLGGTTDEATSDALRDAVVAAATAAVLAWLAASAAARARKLAEELNVADQAGAALTALVTKAREFGIRSGKWARKVGVQAATAVFESAAGESLRGLVERGVIDQQLVRQTWMSRLDDRVRPTHVVAQGQTVSLGTPFAVGAALLRYPGDPLGPLEETAGCRCFRVITVGSGRVTVSV